MTKTDSAYPLLDRERSVLQMVAPRQLSGSATVTHTYLCYQEVFKTRPTFGEVNQLLSQINLAEVMRIIALLNSACTQGVEPPYIDSPQFQAKLETILFARKVREAICMTRWGTTPTDCTIFHRQQQLLLLHLALENCPISGGLEWNESARHRFGLAGLMVNDLLYDRALTGEEMQPERLKGRKSKELSETERWDIRASTLPMFELYMGSSPRNAIGRAQKIWIDLPQDEELRKRAGKDWIDWSVHFHERYRLKLQDFLSVTVALWVYTSQARAMDGDSARFLIFDIDQVMAETSLSREVVQHAIQLLSAKAADLKQTLPMMPRQRVGWDLTALRRNPLIELEGGNLVAYDQTFLLNAATEGIYWLIQESLPDVKTFGNMFGHVYDHYISLILRRISPAERPPEFPRYHRNPFYRRSDDKPSKNDEVADGLINCQQTLVLVEVKASLLSVQGKYSGDGAVLKKQVDDKFALGTGAKQLASAVNRIASGHRPNISGFDASGFRHVSPILISYDSAISTPFMCQYINEVFRGQLGRLPAGCRLRIGKVIVLSSYDVELLEAVCRNKPFANVLKQFQSQCSIDTPFRFFLQGAFPDLLNHSEVLAASAFQDTAKLTQGLLFGDDGITIVES